MQASERENNLESQMATVRSTITDEQSAAQTDQTELDRIVATIAEVRGKLEQL